MKYVIVAEEMTFLMEDVSVDNELKSTECLGFLFGEYTLEEFLKVGTINNKANF